MSTEEFTASLRDLRIAMENRTELLKRANAAIRGMSMDEWSRECVAKEANKQQQETGW